MTTQAPRESGGGDNGDDPSDHAWEAAGNSGGAGDQTGHEKSGQADDQADGGLAAAIADAIAAKPADELPRIYVATPLTNLNHSEIRTLCAEAALVQKEILAVTVTDRIDAEQWPVVVYAAIDNTAPWGPSEDITPAEVYRTNLTELLQSDALIVLADKHASAGVGQEIEWAARSGIPILYLSSDEKVSRQIQGIPALIQCSRYGEDTRTLGTLVTHFLQHRRDMIADGPRRRASVRLRYEMITDQLRAAWAASRDRTGIALRCGVLFDYVELMLDDPARVAVMPSHLLGSLCAELGVRPPGLRPELGFRATRALLRAADAEGWTDEVIEQVRLFGLARLAEATPGGNAAGDTVDLDTLDAWRAIRATFSATGQAAD